MAGAYTDHDCRSYFMASTKYCHSDFYTEIYGFEVSSPPPSKMANFDEYVHDRNMVVIPGEFRPCGEVMGEHHSLQRALAGPVPRVWCDSKWAWSALP